MLNKFSWNIFYEFYPKFVINRLTRINSNFFCLSIFHWTNYSSSASISTEVGIVMYISVQIYSKSLNITAVCKFQYKLNLNVQYQNCQFRFGLTENRFECKWSFKRLVSCLTYILYNIPVYGIQVYPTAPMFAID